MPRAKVFAVPGAAVAMGLALAIPSATASPAPPQSTWGPHTPWDQPQQAVCGPVAAGQARCLAHVLDRGRDAQGRPTPATTSAPEGLSPSTIESVYGFSSSASAGAGQTIAVVDAYNDPRAASDLGYFSSRYGLPQCTVASGCFTKVNQSGGRLYPATDSGWALEISLDVQWVHAIAPGAKILLVEASSNSFSSLMAAEGYASAHAGYVSNSWGGPEFSTEAQYDHHFTTSGVSYFVAAGDNGLGAQYPSSSPNVVSVGGTSLLFDGSGAFAQETAWSGGGGGCSAYEQATAAQASFSTYPQAGCVGSRATPDVALDADPNSGVAVYDTTPYNGSSGWWSVGGTSAATPMWAARSADLGSPVQAATVYGSTIPFRDIVSGSNGAPALPGYDLATGRGSWDDGPAPVQPSPTAPGAPTALSAAGGTASVSLSWVAPGGSVSSYDVLRSTSPGTEAVLASGVAGTSYVDTSVSPGQTYYYEVMAVNAAGPGPVSNEASATLASSSPPAATLLASFTTSCRRATCTFTSTSTDSGANIVGYTWSGGGGLAGTGPQVRHLYPTSGSYSVLLTVADDQGSSATATGTVSCFFGRFHRLVCR